MAIEFDAGRASKIEKADQQLQAVLRVDLQPIGQKEKSLSEACRLMNRHLRDGQGNIPANLTAEQLGRYEQVLFHMRAALDNGIEYLLEDSTEGKKAQQDFTASINEVIQSEEGGAVDSKGAETASFDLDEAINFLDSQIVDALGQVGAEKVKRALGASHPREKTETSVKPPEGFNPEQYRDIELPKKIESYKKLRAIVKTFGRTDVILSDAYDVRNLRTDQELIRQARIELETEAINVAAEPAKVAQIRDFILPALGILEKRLTEKSEETTREANRSTNESWKRSVSGLTVYAQVEEERKKTQDALVNGKSQSEYITLYTNLQQKEIEFQLRKDIEVGRLPDSAKQDGITFFQNHAQETKSLLDKVKEKILDSWKAEVDKKPEVKALEIAIVNARSPGDKVSTIETQEKAINDAIAALNPLSQWTISLPLDLQVEAQQYVREKTERVDQKVRGTDGEERSVRDVLTEAKKEAANREVGEKKQTVSQTIRDILDTALREDSVDARAKAQGMKPNDYLQGLKNRLENDLHQISLIDSDFSPLQYGEAKQKINSLIEVVRLKNLDYPGLVEEILSRNLDPYIANAQMIVNETDRLIVNRFQQFSLPESAIDEEKEKFHRARIKIFCTRYEIVHGGTENMPAADTDKLYELMDPKNWGLTRVDILSFTNEETEGRNGNHVGENVQEMLRYLVEVGGKRVDIVNGNRVVKAGYAPTPEEDPATYSEIIKTVGGRNPKERLKAFAHTRFVEPRKTQHEDGTPLSANELKAETFKLQSLREDEFKLAWQLYYTFDLFGISLALRQKWTQTRAHNSHQKDDPNYITRPFHVGAQKLNRYGNDVNSLMWLYQFAGTYPETWAYAHGDTPYDGIQRRQELAIAFTQAAMPIEGIIHTMFPDPREEDQKEAFIYFFSTTAERQSRPVVKGERVNVIDFNEAQKRFVRQFADSNDKEEIARIEQEIAAGRATPDELALFITRLYNANIDVYYSRMWDQPVFPDHLDFLTRPLLASEAANWTEAQSLANYTIAQKGWQKALDMAIGDIAKEGKVTYDSIFGDGGLWEQFVNSGLGLAKLVPGNHHKLFGPLMRYFIGRIGALFVADPGKDDVEERIRLAKKLVESISQAMKPGEGGLDGPIAPVDLQDIVDDLKNYVDKPLVMKVWKRVPDLLRPEKTRIEEYKVLVRASFEQKYKKPAPPEGWKGHVRNIIPQAGILIYNRHYSYNELRDFNDMMERVEWPERPASRKKDVDTSQKK